jgi:hypothetical protein
LPLAFVMVAGPQIMSAVFFGTSVNWKGASAAYVLGAAVSVTAFFTAAYRHARLSQPTPPRAPDESIAARRSYWRETRCYEEGA